MRLEDHMWCRDWSWVGSMQENCLLYCAIYCYTPMPCYLLPIESTMVYCYINKVTLGETSKDLECKWQAFSLPFLGGERMRLRLIVYDHCWTVQKRVQGEKKTKKAIALWLGTKWRSRRSEKYECLRIETSFFLHLALVALPSGCFSLASLVGQLVLSWVMGLWRWACCSSELIDSASHVPGFVLYYQLFRSTVNNQGLQDAGVGTEPPVLLDFSASFPSHLQIIVFSSRTPFALFCWCDGFG